MLGDISNILLMTFKVSIELLLFIILTIMLQQEVRAELHYSYKF